MTAGRPTRHDLWSVFSAVAAAVPERVAVRSSTATRTYADVAARAGAFARFLSGEGLGCHRPPDTLAGWEMGQDLVALYLLNSPEHLEAMLGAFGARTAPANVNHRYVEDELAYVLDDGQAGAVRVRRRGSRPRWPRSSPACVGPPA